MLPNGRKALNSPYRYLSIFAAMFLRCWLIANLAAWGPSEFPTPPWAGRNAALQPSYWVTPNRTKLGVTAGSIILILDCFLKEIWSIEPKHEIVS